MRLFFKNFIDLMNSSITSPIPISWGSSIGKSFDSRIPSLNNNDLNKNEDNIDHKQNN